MPANNHLLNLQVRNRILHHSRRIDIIRMHAIRDVAVHKQLPRLAVAHGRLGDPAVGAPDPEDLRRLAFAQLDEGIGVALGRLLRVDAASFDDAVDGV
jgi:hypothetical protein